MMGLEGTGNPEGNVMLDFVTLIGDVALLSLRVP